MTWQDAILSVGTVFYIIGLLPTLFGSEKPASATALVTGLVTALSSVVALSFGLYFAWGLSALDAILWFIVFWQTLRRKNHDADKWRSDWSDLPEQEDGCTGFGSKCDC